MILTSNFVRYWAEFQPNRPFSKANIPEWCQIECSLTLSCWFVYQYDTKSDSKIRKHCENVFCHCARQLTLRRRRHAQHFLDNLPMTRLHDSIVLFTHKYYDQMSLKHLILRESLLTVKFSNETKRNELILSHCFHH